MSSAAGGVTIPGLDGAAVIVTGGGKSHNRLASSARRLVIEATYPLGHFS